jgi:hypothetical protein
MLAFAKRDMGSDDIGSRLNQLDGSLGHQLQALLSDVERQVRRPPAFYHRDGKLRGMKDRVVDLGSAGSNWSATRWATANRLLSIALLHPRKPRLSRLFHY